MYEIGRYKISGKKLLRVNSQFFRPAEVEVLWGNPEKAEKELGWKREVSFENMVERMLLHDIELVKKQLKSECI